MYKQAIVLRADLKMGKGKLVAQGSHASISSYNKTKIKHPEIAKEWEYEGQKKIVLKVNSESDLMAFFEQVKKVGIPVELIHDAGHTQVEPGTATCFGAGPWDELVLDKILGKLKLL